MTRHRFGTVNTNSPAAKARKRDYNSKAHKDERAKRVAAHTPSSPCTYCRRPLGPNRSDWHLPHKPDRSGYEPGLACAPCNRKEAARRGAQAANAKRKGQRPRPHVLPQAVRDWG
jgi:hypothetical protein